MRETNFIQQNKEKWDEFEKKFESEKDPEKVSNLFIQITDDLSYSRTYYPNRSVKIYLNNLAQKVFQSIYKNKVRRRKKFIDFWKEELPQRMYEARWQLLFGFMLFTISFFIGIFSSMHDPDFAKFILPEGYTEMTEENIRSGDPMKVYKESNQFDMALSITFNNLWVSFLLLAFGIFFGLGTAFFIMYNGIMIGAFQYFFIERDLFRESFLTIWVHGALEISAIVVAGTAGFTLGKALLFPGTYTRLQSFRINGMRAIQIFLGITPIIILAGFNESFLTRLTETPDVIRGLLIAIEFLFMIFYFVIYPARKAKLGFKTNRRSDEIPADKIHEYDLQKIKTNGEVFSDSFMVLRRFIAPILITIILAAIVYCLIYFWRIENFSEVNHRIYFADFKAVSESVNDIIHLLSNHSNIELFLLNTITFALLTSLCFYIIEKINKQEFTFNAREFFVFIVKKSWFILICSGLIHLLLMIDLQFMTLVFFIALPYFFFIITDIVRNKRISWEGFKSIKYYAGNFLSIQLLYIPLIMLSIMLSFMAHSIIAYFNIELIKWNIPFDAKLYEAVQDITITFVLMVTVFLQICMIAINMALLYYSFYQVSSADELMIRIRSLGSKPKKSFTA